MGTSRRTTRTADPKRAIGYLRCSTDHQDLSPDAQREAITRWATANGVEVVSWHFDKGISGSAEIGDRPELLAALADLRVHGAGVLVVAKRDRLARDTLVSHLIERAAVEQGARVVSADGVANGDDPASIMLRKILDVVAEYERRIIRARIVAALAVKKQRRERTGSVPYGFVLATDARSLLPEPHEQDVIELARSYRATGMTFRAVASILEGRGFTSRTGKRFHATQIQRMVA